MIHLVYPRKRGFFYWDELGCLSRALGFSDGLFFDNLPERYTQVECGIDVKDLLYLLDVQRCLHVAVDRTVNIHTDEWNLTVIKKSMGLLQKKLFSFEELHAIRVSYQLYECLDTRGMSLNENTLQRAIKLCGRMISPLKMMQRLKHMQPQFEEEDRIQLLEFLSLLLWCDPYTEAVVSPPELDRSKDEKNMFKLEDFRQMLTCYDERLAKSLDQQYLQQERKFAKERHTSHKLPRDVPPVDPEPRRKQVKYHKERYRGLQEEVDQSEKKVHEAKAGYVRQRPVSAPDLRRYISLASGALTRATSSRPYSVRDIASPWITRPSTGRSAKSECVESDAQVPRPSIRPRPHTAPVVTSSHIRQTQADISALNFEMETIDVKHQQFLYEDMDFLLPGYRERKAQQVKEPTPPPTPPKPVKEVRPSEETLNNLAYPCHRGPPPTHAKTCDARFRGWTRGKGARASPFILVRPTFNQSNTGRMLQKLNQSYRSESRQGDFVHRSLKRSNRGPSQRPKTAPALMSQGTGHPTKNRFEVQRLSIASSTSRSAQNSEEKDHSTELASNELKTHKTQSTVLPKEPNTCRSTALLPNGPSDVRTSSSEMEHTKEKDGGGTMANAECLPSFQAETTKNLESKSAEGKNDTRLIDQIELREGRRPKYVELGKVGRVAVLEEIREAEGEMEEEEEGEEEQEDEEEEEDSEDVEDDDEDEDEEEEEDGEEDEEEKAGKIDGETEQESEEKNRDLATATPVSQSVMAAQAMQSIHREKQPSIKASISCNATQQPNTGVRVSNSLRYQLRDYQGLVDLLLEEPEQASSQRKGSLKRLARSMGGYLSKDMQAKLVAAN